MRLGAAPGPILRPRHEPGMNRARTGLSSM
jgi:hypothetical protein